MSRRSCPGFRARRCTARSKRLVELGLAVRIAHIRAGNSATTRAPTSTTTWSATDAAPCSTSSPRARPSAAAPAFEQASRRGIHRAVSWPMCASCSRRSRRTRRGCPRQPAVTCSISLSTCPTPSPRQKEHDMSTALKGSKTHTTSRPRSPARARPTAATSTSRRSPTSRATPKSPATSATPPKARPATRTATSTSSRRPATRRPTCRSATRRST
jgi:hypothetical protein